MPSIEREIPYTLTAYSGGMANDDTDKSVSPADEHVGSPSLNLKLAGRQKSSAKSPKAGNQSQDIYDFKESDEDGSDKKNKSENENTAVRSSITNDQEELRQESECDNDDEAETNEDEENRDNSNADADD